MSLLQQCVVIGCVTPGHPQGLWYRLLCTGVASTHRFASANRKLAKMASRLLARVATTAARSVSATGPAVARATGFGHQASHIRASVINAQHVRYFADHKEELEVYTGSCHCGTCEFEVDGPPNVVVRTLLELHWSYPVIRLCVHLPLCAYYCAGRVPLLHLPALPQCSMCGARGV